MSEETARAGDRQAEVLKRLERRLAWSKLALWWERLWPALVLPGMVVALCLAAAWFGIFGVLGPTERVIALAVAGVALAASLVPLARVVPPTRREAVRRLDASEGITNRPVNAVLDRLPANADDTTKAIWRLHIDRELARVDAVRVAAPHPDVSRRDPYQLRYAVLLVALVGLIYAGPQSLERLVAPFRAAPAAVAIPARVDAWVAPPAYTGRPPVFLNERVAEDEQIRVPQNSILTVRVDRSEGVALMRDGAAVEGEDEARAGAPAAASGGPRLFKLTLERDSVVELQQEGRPARSFRFSIEPDRPPLIALEGQIQQTTSGALRLRYRVEDDYGVATARVAIERVERPAPVAGRSNLAVAAPREARPLYGAPEFPLTLPQARSRAGTGTTTRDLTSHPWAGARVRATLVATDDAQQEGRSETVFVELPQRRFEKPLARAVVEQRRTLAMDGDSRHEVAAVLDLLTLDPERRVPEVKSYLGLRSGYFRLLAARTDEDLRAVVDHLWEVALLIEDGDLSAAERALREAQERLEQALERGATPEEIRRLMEELRQAMNEVMREMMRQAMRDMQQGREPRQPQGNERVISQQDIERLMREIEEQMRAGNRDAARNLMSQLREMLEAMRNARPTMQGQQSPQQQMLDELGNMIREQQRLMDQTFRERQQRRQQQGQQGQRGQQGQQGQRGQRGQQGQQGQQGEQGDGGEGGEGGDGDQAMRDLQRGQGQLREQLQRFLDQLRQGGRQPGRELGDAEGQMGQAEGELGRGSAGEALGPQNRALDNLRRGAQQMSREMMGQGEGEPNGQPGQGQGQANGQRRPSMNDPLQRNTPDEFLQGDVRVPGARDRQRIQDILEDVRRRLADPSRPMIEMEYLQRLLRPF